MNRQTRGGQVTTHRHSTQRGGQRDYSQCPSVGPPSPWYKPAMADDPSGNLYEEAVGRPLGPGIGALPPPRSSASVVLWRRLEGGGQNDFEVYWVKRAEQLAFMGGWHAFPGGGMSRSDAALPVSGEPQVALDASPATDEALGPDLLPGLAACALRELFEETGILLSIPAVDPEELPEPRRALLAG